MLSKNEVESVSIGGKDITIFEDSHSLVYGKVKLMARSDYINYILYVYEGETEDEIIFELVPLVQEGAPQTKSWCVRAETLKKIKNNIKKILNEIDREINNSIAFRGSGSITRLDVKSSEMDELIVKISKYREKIKREGIKLGPNSQEFSNETTNLQNAKNKYIWIFCEVKDVICLWDWIYLEQSKNFLGDEFFLVRLSRSVFDKNNSNFKIENPVAWMDKSKYSKDQISDLESKLKNELKRGLKKEKIRKSALFSLFKKPVADFIHIAAKEAKIYQIVKGNNANFVFSNICGCNNPLYLSEVQNSSIPTLLIETSFKMPEAFSCRFAGEFYHAFLKEKKTMADAFMEVRKTLKEDDLMNVWRLAYVMYGNPFAQVIY